MRPGFRQRYDFPIHLLILIGNVRHRLSLWWHTRMTRLWLALAGCPVGPGFKACGRPHLRVVHRGAIRLGANVTLQSRRESNMAGGTGPTTIQCFDGGRVIFGNNSGCSFATISSRSSVTIGNDVSIGANTRIFDHDFHPLDPTLRRENATANVVTRPIVIGDNVFIGAQSIILKGVTIGEDAIIGAGAVVTRDIPPREIWAGNPARRIGTLSPTVASPEQPV